MPKPRTGVSQPPTTSPPQLEFSLVVHRPQDSPDRGASPDTQPAMASGAEETPAPTFAMVRESGIDGEKRCLYLVVETTQREQFRLDFTPGCIPLTVSALSSELGFLQQNQLIKQELVQPIVVNACSLGETANGSPALLARMEGGGELPLQMSLPELRHLARQIDDYVRSKMKGRTRP